MIQAARSGVQNIAEGSQAAGTSKKTEIKLTNVARASLEELRLDYEDFLRQRGLPMWSPSDPRRAGLIARRCSSAEEVAQWVQEQHDGLDGRGELARSRQNASPRKLVQSTKSISSIEFTSPEIAANAVLVLITVACNLLDRQLKALAEAFERDGAFTERLYRVRTNARRGAK